MILSGDTLYGTTSQGGTAGYGTIFSVSTNDINQNNAGIESLYSFTNGSDGATPKASLILSGATLYGTASQGGNTANGTVSPLNLSAHPPSFKLLYAFTNGNDGGDPEAGLVLEGSTLCGTTYYGGTSNVGTIFSVHTDGTGFTTLYEFTNGFDGSAIRSPSCFSGQFALWHSLYRRRFESRHGFRIELERRSSEFEGSARFCWHAATTESNPASQFDVIGRHPVWDDCRIWDQLWDDLRP